MKNHPPCYQALQAASLAIHRLLLNENDLPTLLQGICDELTTVEGNQSAWIALLDSESGGVITAESGLGDRFERIMAPLREAKLPECGRRCLARKDTTVVVCRHCDCGVCDATEHGSAEAIAVALRCRPGLAGFLVVDISSSGEPGHEGIRLFEDLAHSIGQALRRLFSLEESRQREQELEKVEERFELALYASQAGLWDWNIKTGEMYTSPDRKEFLDYRQENSGHGVAPLHGVIHPADQDKVLQVLNEHLAGKTDEYLIEYRIKDRQGNWKWFLDRGRVVERDEKNMPVRMTGTHQDITRRKNQEETLAAVRQQLHEAVDHERNFLQTVIDGAADPVMAIDSEYNILLMNKIATELFQVDSEQVLLGEKKCYQLFAGSDQPCTDSRYPCPVREVQKNKTLSTMVHNPYHGNGINNTFEIEVSPLRDKAGEIYGTIEVGRDISDRLRIEKELRESKSRLYRLAHHDFLTGLPNRLLFEDRLKQAILKAGRADSKVAILFLDLDRFKVVNDTLGHDVGDGLLVEIARRLQAHCRKSDTVARIGGDEFVYILDDIQGRSNAELVAGKIMAAMEPVVSVAEHELQVSTSIGIALYPDDADTIDGVIKCADTALYKAKGEGRNIYKVYNREMLETHDPFRLQESQLAMALEQEQFFLEYQCQFDVATSTIVGLEALLRWRHPEQGVLYPYDFLPVAEESGKIVPIGHWIMFEVCRQISTWRQAGVVVPPVAVNVSPRQLLDPGFRKTVADALAQYSLPPQFLELELDEAVMMEGCCAEGLRELEQVSRLGVRLAIEDFGSGRFSLDDLQRLPLSRLKIDRSFLGCLRDANVAIIVEAIIVLAHNLGITVLAEGVEQEEHLRFLREHGCDQAQGFFLARPGTAEVVEQVLAGK